MIISRTPFRVSFFGGGTDIPSWFESNGGEVLSTSIDKYCYISCRNLPKFFEHNYRIVYSKIELIEKIHQIQHPAVRNILNYYKCNNGLEIHHDGDLPARSGLGSSSAFTVGLINAISALNGNHISKDKLAQEAIHIEQNIIKECVGSQDQISATYGGFNNITFNKDHTFQVSPVIVSSQRLKELKDHLLLMFTNTSRYAETIEKEKVKNFKTKEKTLFEMQYMVKEGINILTSNQSILKFGELLNSSWKLKKTLSDTVSNNVIDDLYDTAMSKGALGGKLLGAGGGGFLLLFASPHLHKDIKSSLKNLIHVPFNFENSGSKISLYQPQGF